MGIDIAGDHPATIVQPFDDVPNPEEYSAVMVDAELKNHWCEDTDVWFFTQIINRIPPEDRYVLWCKEDSEDAET